MSAHLTTMRRQDRQQDETTEELTEQFPKTHHPVTCQYVTKTDSSAVINQPERMLAFTRLDNTRSIPSPSVVTKRESTRYHDASSNVFHRPDTHMIVVCAVHTRPSTDSRALLTNEIRTCFESLSQGCSNVVLPFLNTVRMFPSN